MNLFSRIAEALDLPLDELIGLEPSQEDQAARLLEEMHDCLGVLKQMTALAIARCRLLRRELERHDMTSDRSTPGVGRETLIQELGAEEKGAQEAAADLKASIHSIEKRLFVASTRHRARLLGGAPGEPSPLDFLVAEFHELEARLKSLGNRTS